ncbi:hypothetical protein H1Q59_06505, partial [Holosporaceae bacterium 'Namur']|nr:hypothetical protein [Holosporaceae bacterium 'Namur']
MVSNIKSHHEQYYMDYQQFIKELNSNEVYKLIIKRVNASLLNKIEDLIIDHPNFNNIFEKDILLNFYPDADCVFSALQNSNLQLKIEEDIRSCKKAHALISNINNFKNINLCERLSESEYLVLFLGPTGAAKSTLISYLIKNELILYRIEEGIVLVNSPNNKAPIKIGEGDEKGTSEINIYQDKEKKIFYIDLPGLNDVDIIERIRNAFEFKKLFDCKNELNIKLAFVIPNNYIFDTDRFQKLPSFFEDIKGIIPNIYNSESKFSNSLFIFSRGPRYQGEKNIKSKIEKAIKIRELSLEFEQFLGKLAEEFEDRITIFPAPNQENQDHIIFNELNTRHVYKDFHYREQIIKLLEKQKPIKLNEKDFNTVINNDKEIIQALNIYKYYSINKFNNLLYTINNYLNNNNFESLETLKIILEYLISDRVNYSSNHPVVREETLLKPIELAFQEYNKISNITINFQKILNQDSKEFLNNIQNEVNDKIEEIKNTIFELYFKYMLNYSQSLNELITNKIKEIGFDEKLSTLLDVFGSFFLKNNSLQLTQEQLEQLTRNYGNIDVIEAFSKYFELRYNLYNKFIINSDIKYQIEAKNLIKEVDEYVSEQILSVIDEYYILNACYIKLNDEFFVINREFNITEYFKQSYHTYEYWKAYELNENVQFKILKLFSICKNLKIQKVDKLEEIINSRLLDDESKCSKDYDELIQKIERTELTKEVTESKTCYFKGVVPGLSEVIGNSDNCRVIKIFGQYGIELDLETQITPPELRELYLIAPHTVLTKEKSSPIGNLNVNRLHFIASENEITLLDLDKQEGTVKLIRALYYPFSDFTKQNISLCEDLVSFQIAKTPLPRNNNIFINKVIFTSFVLAKNTFVGLLCGVSSRSYFNKVWKFNNEDNEIIAFVSAFTGIILVNLFTNPIYILKSSFILGSIGGVMGGIIGKISFGNDDDAGGYLVLGVISGAISGAVGINNFNKTLLDLILPVVGMWLGGIYSKFIFGGGIYCKEGEGGFVATSFSIAIIGVASDDPIQALISPLVLGSIGGVVGGISGKISFGNNHNSKEAFHFGVFSGTIIGLVGTAYDYSIHDLIPIIVGMGLGGIYGKFIFGGGLYCNSDLDIFINNSILGGMITGVVSSVYNKPMQILIFSTVSGIVGGSYLKIMPINELFDNRGSAIFSITSSLIGAVSSVLNRPIETLVISSSLSLLGSLFDKSTNQKIPIFTCSGAVIGIIWGISDHLEWQYFSPVYGATIGALNGMVLMNNDLKKGAYWGSIVGIIPGAIVGFSEKFLQTALSSVAGGILGILNGMYHKTGPEYSVVYMGIGSSVGALINNIGKVLDSTLKTKESMEICYKEFYLKTRDNKFIAPGDNDLIFKIDQEDIDIENLNQYIWYQDETETLLINKQNNKCLQLNNNQFYVSTMCSYARAIYPEAKKKGYVSQDQCIKYLNYAINHDKAVIDTADIPLKEDKVKEEYLEWLKNLGFDYKHNISFTYFNEYKQSTIEDVSVINERPNQSDKKTCIENLLKLGKYSEKPYQQGNYEVFLNKRILNSKGNLKKSEENEEILMILSEVLDLDLPKAYCEYIRLFKTNNQYNNFFVSDIYRKLSEDILALKTNYFISSSQSLDDKSMRVRDLRQDLEEEGKSQVEINNEINIFLTNYNNQFSSWITGEAEKNIKAKEIELEKALSEAGIPMQQQLIYSARVQCNNAERNDAKTAFNMLVGDDRGVGKYEPLIIYRNSPLSGENNNNCISYNSIQEINFKFPWIVKELLNIEIFFDQGLESKDLQKSIEIRDKICKKVPNSIIIGFDEEYMSSTEKDSKKILAIKYNNYCGSLPWDNPLIHMGEEKYSYLSAREILIDEALKRSNTVVVYGIPGIDKTLFVSEYIRSRFTKDVNNKKEIWKFNAENSETLYKSFCKFAVFLGEAIENLKDLTPTKIGKLVEEKLATLSKYLNLVVIFDNVSNDLNKNDLKDYLKAFNKDVIKI